MIDILFLAVGIPLAAVLWLVLFKIITEIWEYGW